MLKFEKMPLRDFINFLPDTSGLDVSVEREALEDVGFALNAPVSICRKRHCARR